MKRIYRVVGVLGGVLGVGSGWMLWAQAQQQSFPFTTQGESLEAVIAAARARAALEPIAEKTIPVFTLGAASPPGTYWMLQSDTPPLPFDPLPELLVYPLGDNLFLVDDRSVDYAGLAAQQAAEAEMLRALERSLGLTTTLDSGPPPPPGGGEGGGTNEPPVYGPGGYAYGSNDLWLEILTVTNATAFLTIHPPWGTTHGVYDLHYTTNLAPTMSWEWLLRSDPGQTNLAVTNATDAQGFYRLAPPNDLKVNSSLGTNFWLAFFRMVVPANLSLYISSPVGATGTVTLPRLEMAIPFAVTAGGGTNVLLTEDAYADEIMMLEYDVVGTNGIHVTASQPVAVYALEYYRACSAAFTCYPTPLLGTNYCLLARPSFLGGYSSQFAIVAIADNTTVWITPSPTANLTHPGNITNNLQEGETYQIGSSNATSDVTGTWITSDKPVAVFAGASGAFVPNDDWGAANPLVQEQLPAESWGTEALAIPFAGRSNGDTYRVLAATNETVVFTNGVVAGTNQAGQFLDLVIDGPVEFHGTKPIQVAHFANGAGFEGPYNHMGDPCEILLPATAHYLVTNTVCTLTNDYVTAGFDENYLNLIVAQAATNSTWVDGSLVAVTNYVPIGTSGYYGAQITVTNSGVHIVTSSQPVGVEVYGWGDSDAYGYFGGVVK